MARNAARCRIFGHEVDLDIVHHVMAGAKHGKPPVELGHDRVDATRVHHAIAGAQDGVFGKELAHAVDAAIIDIEAVPRHQLANLRFGLKPGKSCLYIVHNTALPRPSFKAGWKTMIRRLIAKTIMNVWKGAIFGQLRRCPIGQGGALRFHQ